MRSIKVVYSNSHREEDPRQPANDLVEDSIPPHEGLTSNRASPMVTNASFTDSSDADAAPSHIEKTMIPSTSCSQPPQRKSAENKPFIRLDTVTRGDLPCRSQVCICRCHKVTRRQPLSWVSNVFGDLLIGYSGISMPMMSRVPCSESGCQRRETGRITATYYVPSWALISTRVVSFFSSWNGLGNDTQLRYPNIIDASADIFVFAQKGNIQGIQQLFAQKLASINDISATEGRSALHVSKCDQLTYKTLLPVLPC